MKRIFLIIFILLLCSLVSCKGKAKEYKVTFKNGEQQEVVKYKENEHVEFETLTQEGYQFNGWMLDGQVVNEYVVTSDVTFIASFSKLKFNISFDIDGQIQTKEFEYGESVVFPNAEKEGYTFSGWTLNGETVESYVIKEEVTFVATYAEVNYIALAKEYLTGLFPAESTTSFNLPLEYNGVSISWKSSNAKAITVSGEVTQLEYKATVTLTATLTFNDLKETAKFKVVVPKLDDEVILNRVLNEFDFDPTIKNQKLDLITDFSTKNSTINGTWESLNPEYLNNSGSVLVFSDSEKEVEIKLTLSLRDASVTKTYKVVIPAMSSDELVELALENANIETIITSNTAYLPTEFEYDLVGKWNSSDTSIIDNNGNVLVNNGSYKEVKMTLTLNKVSGEEVKKVDYTFKVNNKTHLPIVHARDFNAANMSNVELENGRLVLTNGQTYGEYESDILETIDFNNCVPSWAAVTSKDATVEFQIKARVNRSWSKYISYSSGGWGLGLQNKSYDTSDSLVKLVTDEFMILNNKSADAIQFKLILRRTNAANESPQVSLCAFALKGTSYVAPTYSLDELPSYVKHDVPKLYQQVVPTIGGSICSPTSCTMLLKSKGMDFSDKDSQFEHRYIANLAKDYGNNIFGNWVYCTVTMGAFGFNAYVARFYSVAELCHHIATVGPVACSMKGQMTSDKKDYYTAGHLITIIGYEYKDGVLTLISNDPNVSEVECRYSESVFTATWRNISYIIE